MEISKNLRKTPHASTKIKRFVFRPKKCPLGRIFGAQTTSAWTTVEIECAALTSAYDRNNSGGKASLKRHKSLEITTDTQDVRKFY